MWTFSCPTIVYGDNALNYLQHIQEKKAFVVTEKDVVQSGLIHRVTDEAKAAGLQCLIFDQIDHALSQELVERGGRMVGEYQPDWIIALGGGACVQTATSITRQMAANSPGGRADRAAKARLMVIPVHLGAHPDLAAQEGESTEQPTDHPMEMLRGGRPEVAILDPEMFAPLSEVMVADTCMGALCKAIEGYVSPWGSSLTDGPALMAIRLVLENLPQISQTGDAAEARMQLQQATFLSELSSSQVSPGLAQCTAQALSATHLMPYGVAAGLMLPYVMTFLINGSIQITAKYAEIARYCGLTNDPSLAGALALVASIQSCARNVGHPLTLAQAIAPKEQFEASLPDLIAKTLVQTALRSAARVPDQGQLTELFRYAYEGKQIDF
jgi:alcohol dehydrogenase class IV